MNSVVQALIVVALHCLSGNGQTEFNWLDYLETQPPPTLTYRLRACGAVAGMPALFNAAITDDLFALSFHLDNGADVLARLNRSQATPLFLACCAGLRANVDMLLDYGADPRDKDVDNASALIAACFGSDNYEVAELLLSRGANISGVDRDGDSALHAAALMGHFRSIGLLYDMGADINLLNHWGETPLMYAVIYNRFEASSLLLTLGADPAIRAGSRNETARDLAFRLNFTEIYSLLTDLPNA